MKKVKNGFGAQGDLYFRRLDKCTTDKLKKAEKKDGKYILAHSESGHHHVVDCEKVNFMTSDNPMISFLELLDNGVDILHLKNGKDAHETLRLLGKPGDIWEVRRGRQARPSGEGWEVLKD